MRTLDFLSHQLLTVASLFQDTLRFLGAVLFAHMSWKTNLMTMTVDIFPRSVVASAAGILGMGSGLGGVLFSTVAGHIIKRYSYTPIFVIMGFLHPVAYLLVRWLVRGEAGTSTGPQSVDTDRNIYENAGELPKRARTSGPL